MAASIFGHKEQPPKTKGTGHSQGVRIDSSLINTGTHSWPSNWVSFCSIRVYLLVSQAVMYIIMDIEYQLQNISSQNVIFMHVNCVICSSQLDLYTVYTHTHIHSLQWCSEWTQWSGCECLQPGWFWSWCVTADWPWGHQEKRWAATKVSDERIQQRQTWD